MSSVWRVSQLCSGTWYIIQPSILPLTITSIPPNYRCWSASRTPCPGWRGLPETAAGVTAPGAPRETRCPPPPIATTPAASSARSSIGTVYLYLTSPRCLSDSFTTLLEWLSNFICQWINVLLSIFPWPGTQILYVSCKIWFYFICLNIYLSTHLWNYVIYRCNILTQKCRFSLAESNIFSKRWTYNVCAPSHQFKKHYSPSNENYTLLIL